MSQKEFKAESKRLLDLMINSIYTHKEIFLRELISNASDASDKLYYKALSENLSDINKEDLKIEIKLNKTNRTITLVDHGIGMNEAQLEENLGTIAKSGSLAFKEEMAKKESGNSDVDIIGQFGVGFTQRLWLQKRWKLFLKNMVKKMAIFGVVMLKMDTQFHKPLKKNMEHQLLYF